MLASRIRQGLGARHGSENLSRLFQKVRTSAFAENKDKKELPELVKIYWLVARVLGEHSSLRKRDITECLRHLGVLHDFEPAADLMAAEDDCASLNKRLTKLRWEKQEDGTLRQAQISPGPLWYFSKAAAPARDLDSASPSMAVSCALTAVPPEELNERDPWMYR
jgi:hypothetical protein